MKRSGSLEQLLPRGIDRSTKQDVGQHLRHSPERNKIVNLPSHRVSLALSPILASGNSATRNVAMVQPLDEDTQTHMPSQEVGMAENTAVWNVDSNHDLATRVY